MGGEMKGIDPTLCKMDLDPGLNNRWPIARIWHILDLFRHIDVILNAIKILLGFTVANSLHLAPALIRSAWTD